MPQNMWSEGWPVGVGGRGEYRGKSNGRFLAGNNVSHGRVEQYKKISFKNEG